MTAYQPLKNHFFSLSLFIFLLFSTTHCTKKHSSAPTTVLDTSFVNLGTPGELNTQNNTQKDPHVHDCTKDSSLKITPLDDKGKIKIEGDSLKNYSFQNNDSVIGYFDQNLDQSFHLSILDIIEKNKNYVIMQTQLGNFTGLSKNSESFEFSYEYTPKFINETSKISNTTSTHSPSLPPVEIVGKTTKEVPVQNIFSKTEIPKKEENKNLKLYFDDKDNSFNVENFVLTSFSWDTQLSLPHDFLKSSQNKGVKVIKLSGAGKGGQVKITIQKAKFAIQPTFRSHYKFSWGRPEFINSSFDSILSYSLDIKVETTEGITLNVFKDIFPMVKIPVIIPGAIPILVDVEIQIPTGLELRTSGQGNLNYTLTGEHALHADMSYTTQNGFQHNQKRDSVVKEKTLNWRGESKTYSAEIYIEPQLRTRFYKVLAPYAYAHPFFRAQVELPLQKNQDELFMGINGGIGLQVVEPLFETEILNIKRDNLFEYVKSWDIFTSQDDFNIDLLKDYEVQPLHITQRPDEGFVRISLLPPDSEKAFRFKILSYPENGILKPSDDFHLSGEVFYYPLAKSADQQEDEFKVQVYSGKFSKDINVKIKVAENVLVENRKPQFSVSAKSMKVAFGKPEQFRDQVPQLGVFSGGIPIEKAPELDLKSFFNELGRAFKSPQLKALISDLITHPAKDAPHRSNEKDFDEPIEQYFQSTIATNDSLQQELLRLFAGALTADIRSIILQTEYSKENHLEQDVTSLMDYWTTAFFICHQEDCEKAELYQQTILAMDISREWGAYHNKNNSNRLFLPQPIYQLWSRLKESGHPSQIFPWLKSSLIKIEIINEPRSKKDVSSKSTVEAGGSTPEAEPPKMIDY